MRYEITPDNDSEDPTEWSEWEMHSFGRRHSNFCHPDKFGISVNQYGEVECNQIGLRAKLDAGTAFILGYYEHGLCSWFPRGCGGPGTDCRWDGNQCAGIMIWRGKAKDCGTNWEERLKHAKSMCETYTAWCNGEVYSFIVYDENDEEVDSCCGYYGYEDAEKAAKESLQSFTVEA